MLVGVSASGVYTYDGNIEFESISSNALVWLTRRLVTNFSVC